MNNPSHTAIWKSGMALSQVILVASEAVPVLLQWVWVEMDCQLGVCRVTKEDTVVLLYTGVIK
jgi:hypothetical protein